MSIFNLLTWGYWFSQPYIAHGFIKWFWVFFFLCFILLGILSKIWEVMKADRPLKKVWRSFSTTFLGIGILGLLWMFFRQEHVPFLAWRFWLLIIFLSFAWRQYYNLRYLFKRYPQIKAEQEARKEKEKYLP